MNERHESLVNDLAGLFAPQALVLGGQLPPELGCRLIAATTFWGAHRYRAPLLLLSKTNGATLVPLQELFLVCTLGSGTVADHTSGMTPLWCITNSDDGLARSMAACGSGQGQRSYGGRRRGNIMVDMESAHHRKSTNLE